jgi:hypothetical protein
VHRVGSPHRAPGFAIWPRRIGPPIACRRTMRRPPRLIHHPKGVDWVSSLISRNLVVAERPAIEFGPWQTALKSGS